MAWLATFLYDYPYQYLQKDLWKEISGLSISDNTPWMIMEDLMSYQVIEKILQRI